jgi:riboflavin kinase / FMN adenylyltransferase
METILVQSIFDIFSQEETAITIGNFDGVHLGHQLLINDTLAIAKRLNFKSCVLTFNPHPRLILVPQSKLCFLTSLEKKIALIEKMGIDRM